jgi:hypothetical protein
MKKQQTILAEMPLLRDRQLIAWRLYEQAARLLLAAERTDAEQPGGGRRLSAVAARLQALAAWLEIPQPALVPVPVTVDRRRTPRRSA